MSPQDKLNASLKWLRHRNNPRAAEEDERREKGEDLPTAEELRDENRDVPLEKGDLPAMIIAALVTIVPVCILVLAVLCGIIWLLFFH